MYVKLRKNVKGDLTFIFTENLENVNSFVEISLVVDIRYAANLCNT